jgi:hypothetical protein
MKYSEMAHFLHKSWSYQKSEKAARSLIGIKQAANTLF